ncbi:MAG: hypothetical protein H2069_03995 [Legionella sp.]|nr:hypothetical protein [Legionella sp.]
MRAAGGTLPLPLTLAPRVLRVGVLREALRVEATVVDFLDGLRRVVLREVVVFALETFDFLATLGAAVLAFILEGVFFIGAFAIVFGFAEATLAGDFTVFLAGVFLEDALTVALGFVTLAIVFDLLAGIFALDEATLAELFANVLTGDFGFVIDFFALAAGFAIVGLAAGFALETSFFTLEEGVLEDASLSFAPAPTGFLVGVRVLLFNVPAMVLSSVSYSLLKNVQSTIKEC